MRHIKVFVLFFVVVAGFSGCLKNRDAVNTFASSAPIYTMEFITPGGGGTSVNSGLQFFSSGALLYPATDATDTATFTVRLTGSPASSDVTVTVAPDAKALLDNFKTDSISYEAMPDSLYKFINTTGTIKKGTNVASFQVVFYPSKINPTKNYMLTPTVITPTDHQTSGNFGHIYFHTIGNLFAGAYKVTGTRYNYNGAVAWNNVLPVPAGYASTNSLTANKTAAPNSGSVFEILFSNLGSTDYQYVVTSNDVAKTLSVDYTFDNIYSNFSTAVINIVYPNATTKASFEILTHYNNALAGAGNDRIIDEKFVQQ